MTSNRYENCFYEVYRREVHYFLRDRGWTITKAQITDIVHSPKWKGDTKYDQETAMGVIGEAHILRVVFSTGRDAIKIITFHIAKKGRYESNI